MGRRGGEEGEMPGPPVSGRSGKRFLWLLGRKSGLEDCGGSEVVVEASMDAALWGSGGPCRGGSGVGREAARLSLPWRQGHRARCQTQDFVVH